MPDHATEAIHIASMLHWLKLGFGVHVMHTGGEATGSSGCISYPQMKTICTSKNSMGTIEELNTESQSAHTVTVRFVCFFGAFLDASVQIAARNGNANYVNLPNIIWCCHKSACLEIVSEQLILKSEDLSKIEDCLKDRLV